MIRPADPADLPTIPWDRDEPLLQEVRRTGAPRLDVCAWDAVAVVIGRGGRQALEVDRAAVAADGVPLYRRPGGGCAVVLDPGNVILSVGLPVPGIGGITSSFAAVSAWLADALDRCGVPGVRQRGVSDLVLGERKIGGSCIWRTRNLLYYSTTVLVDPDLDLVERYLPHPPREPDYRAGRAHRAFMGSVRAAGFVGDPGTLAGALATAAGAGLTELGRRCTESS
jgi:lipoate-protein ligase A